MKRKKLFRYFLVSVLIHLGGLAGFDVLLMAPPAMPEQSVLIPVETVVLETRSDNEESSVPFTPKTVQPTREAVVAKASASRGTPSTDPMEDLPGPIPREGSFKPSMNMDPMPTHGALPMGQEGEEMQSKRVVSRSTSLPVRLPPVLPYPPEQSPILDTRDAKILTQVDSGQGLPVRSMKPEKTRAPLGKNRPDPEFVADLPPIPTVTSPTLPEVGEMILAEDPGTVSAPPDGIKVQRPMMTTKPRKDPSDKPSMVGLSRAPKQEISLAPLTTGLKPKAPLLVPGESYSMLLLIDTSGSVKGPPLEGIKRSAMAFVNLLGVTDRCAVITFNDEANLVVPFVSDKDRLNRDIVRLACEGKNTVLFNALDYGFRLLERERDRRRFVVLFSDGKDEGSHVTFQEVIPRAQNSGIVVFCLGYSRIERRYLRNMENIAQQTDGIFAEAPQFQEIVALFRSARDMTKQAGS